MDETKLLNYLKGESDAEECLEVEAWYHASAEHKKQLDQLYYMLFVGERKVAMDGVDTDNSLSVLKDRIKQKESEKKSVHRIRVSKWKRYAMPLAAFLCGVLVSAGALYWISSGKSAFTPTSVTSISVPKQSARAPTPVRCLDILIV